MRFTIFSFVLMLALAVVSCDKDCNLKPTCDKVDCTLCKEDAFKDKDAPKATFMKKYEVKPLVKDPSCNCIVSGLIKYVVNDDKVVLVDYGDGECDAWAVKKTIYKKCGKDKQVECCKFEQDCGKKDDPTTITTLTKNNASNS